MLVIGNGESRKDVNIDDLPSEKVGCNAIIRDYHVDHLVCCDKKMVKQALAQGFSPVYTRDRWASDFDSPHVMKLPDLPYSGDNRMDEPFHWGSGPYAVLLATFLSKYIKLIGFDLYGIDGKLNNIYNGTSGYQKNTDDQVDWSYWVYQIAKILKYFLEQLFF